ncbi:MAG: helix-turn-helix domain-containing protein [Chloroflexi bacterium]|nr:helix-turn-helix domain-containing protein [Chloroflexota bacterium]MYD49650.1 helix-turn-helix domain-containing protein [Chloroflexota bacterium]
MSTATTNPTIQPTAGNTTDVANATTSASAQPANGNGNDSANATLTGNNQPATANGKPETELRAAARKSGLTMKQLAQRMGISNRYLSEFSTGRRPWTPAMQEKVRAVLGYVPGQGVVYRRIDVIRSESTYVRERARELGLSINQLAQRVGISSRHLTDVSRGRNRMSPAVQARLESALGGPMKVKPAKRSVVDPHALWERMDAHGISQNEVARRAGISKGFLSGIMSGRRTPSGDVLTRLHGVLFAPSPAERVMPAEVKVLAWKKGERQGMVIRGAGGPGSGGKVGDGTMRVGGRVPWGAQVEYAYTTGYDGHGRVFVNHLVREPGSYALLKPASQGL